MQTKIFFLIFLGCSIFITANAAKSLLLNKPECTQKRLREVDRNFMKLIVIGENGRKFPESYDELPKFCK